MRTRCDQAGSGIPQSAVVLAGHARNQRNHGRIPLPLAPIPPAADETEGSGNGDHDPPGAEVGFDHRSGRGCSLAPILDRSRGVGRVGLEGHDQFVGQTHRGRDCSSSIAGPAGQGDVLALRLHRQRLIGIAAYRTVPAPNAVPSESEAEPRCRLRDHVDGGLGGNAHATPRSISARMSSTRQTVMRRLSLTGLGKRPDRTPAHHVLLETGIGPVGPRIDDRRTKPVAGSA